MDRVYTVTVIRPPTGTQDGLLRLADVDRPDRRREVSLSAEQYDCLIEASYRFEPGKVTTRFQTCSLVGLNEEPAIAALAREIEIGSSYRRAIGWLVSNLAADGMHAAFDGIAGSLLAVMDRRINDTGVDTAWFMALCTRIVEAGGPGTSAEIVPNPLFDAGEPGKSVVIRVSRNGTAYRYKLGPFTGIGVDHLGIEH